MSWELWGGLVAIVGLVWIYKGEVDVGIEGRPPSFRIAGAAARAAGALLAAVGLCIAFLG